LVSTAINADATPGKMGGASNIILIPRPSDGEVGRNGGSRNSDAVRQCNCKQLAKKSLD